MKRWQTTINIVMLMATMSTLVGCAYIDAHLPDILTGKAEQAKDDSDSQNGPSVKGTLTLSESMPLPENAVVTVMLEDFTSSPTTPRIIATQVFRTDGKQPPFDYVLPYQAKDIQPQQHIMLTAFVAVNGKTIFFNDSKNEILDHQKGAVKDLVLIPVNTGTGIK